MMLEEVIKLHRFAGISPEQFFTEAGRHREAVVAADQRMVIRCFGDDLAGFVHDVFHGPPPIQPFSFERHDPPLPPGKGPPSPGGVTITTLPSVLQPQPVHPPEPPQPEPP